MPSDEQIGAFAHFVPRAHSWYKWLLLRHGGCRGMTFFIFPGSRAQRIDIDAVGRLHQLSSLEWGFHDSSRPTDDRFGHAAYERGDGPLFLIRSDLSEVGPPDDKGPLYRPGAVPFKPGRDELVSLPEHVREAGYADVSGLMHPRAAFALAALQRLGRLDSADIDWPAESGGAAALAEILERVHAVSVDPHLEERAPSGTPDRGHLVGCDFVLYRLLAPERERQQRLIASALERAIDLVH